MPQYLSTDPTAGMAVGMPTANTIGALGAQQLGGGPSATASGPFIGTGSAQANPNMFAPWFASMRSTGPQTPTGVVGTAPVTTQGSAQGAQTGGITQSVAQPQGVAPSATASGPFIGTGRATADPNMFNAWFASMANNGPQTPTGATSPDGGPVTTNGSGRRGPRIDVGPQPGDHRLINGQHVQWDGAGWYAVGG